MIRLLIVDDSHLFREHLKTFLAISSDIDIVGEAENGKTAISKARALNPDIVLMDVNMEGISGLTATRLLKKELPGIQVILLSLSDLEGYREAAEAVGASAYVCKKHLVDELLPVIRRVRQSNRSA